MYLVLVFFGEKEKKKKLNRFTDVQKSFSFFISSVSPFNVLLFINNGKK